MPKLTAWCQIKKTKVKSHRLDTIEAVPTQLPAGISAVAKAIPSHYASEERVADLMRKLGKKATASYIEEKLPTSTSIRSGDLGEILATDYVADFTNYTTSINRLRWKDHRNMAMRGDDIVAVEVVSPSKINFLKGEVKSSKAISKQTIARARAALRRDRGRPSAHTLSFLADRLHAKGEHQAANLIEKAQLVSGIKRSQVAHLLFVFSGSDPTAHLTADLSAYKGSNLQHAVGLRVQGHQAFIKAVYEKVIKDA